MQLEATSNRCCRWCAEQETKGGAAAAAAAVTTHGGDRVFLSQARGVLLAVDTATMQIADAVKVSAAGAHRKQQTACSMHPSVVAAGCTVCTEILDHGIEHKHHTRCRVSAVKQALPKATVCTLDRAVSVLLLRRCLALHVFWRCRSIVQARCCWRCAATASFACSRCRSSVRRPRRCTLLTPCAGRSPASRCVACPTTLQILCTACTFYKFCAPPARSCSALLTKQACLLPFWLDPGGRLTSDVLPGSKTFSVGQMTAWFIVPCLVRSRCHPARSQCLVH